MIDLPIGGRAVLQNIAQGRSVWHGWEAGHAVRTPEGQEAYARRAAAIQACRDRGLLTTENLLTETGRKAVKAMAEVHLG